MPLSFRAAHGVYYAAHEQFADSRLLHFCASPKSRQERNPPMNYTCCTASGTNLRTRFSLARRTRRLHRRRRAACSHDGPAKQVTARCLTHRRDRRRAKRAFKRMRTARPATSEIPAIPRSERKRGHPLRHWQSSRAIREVCAETVRTKRSNRRWRRKTATAVGPQLTFIHGRKPGYAAITAQVLEAAPVISASARGGAFAGNAVRFLLAHQDENGSWPDACTWSKCWSG